MKRILTLPAFMVWMLGGSPAQADVLSKTVHVSLTGIIVQGGATKAVPITPRNMLLLFGYPFVQACTVKYFQDTSTSSFVLASRDGTTIYGTIFMVGQTSGQVDYGSKNYFMAACSAASGALQGTTYGTLFFRQEKRLLRTLQLFDGRDG